MQPTPIRTREGSDPSRVTDFDYIPIETTEGHRPPSPAADRLLIGLAAVALCGGLLIAAGNFLGADDAVSVASESPGSSAEPSRTPRPTRSPRPRLELAVQPAALPSPQQEPFLFSGWIRASTDLVVRGSPTEDARQLGILAEGSFAQVQEMTEQQPGEQGWLQVNAPQPGGWVATLDGGTPLAHRYSDPPYVWGASVWTIAAGDGGFVAIGSEAGRSDRRSEPLALVSTDGARWRAVDPPAEWASGWNQSVAWGPMGWLSATHVDDADGPAIWFSQSDDARGWDSLGALSDLPRDSWLGQLVASERGYLLWTSGQQQSFWFSSDGVTWRESEESGLNSNGSVRVAATSLGFYAWEDNWGETATEAAFSTDGSTWLPVADGPEGSGREIVSVGDRLLGLDADPGSGEPRLWVGIPARGSIAWVRDTDADEFFRGAAPSALTSDGDRALIFGWDRSTEEPLVWSSEPTGWRRSELPGMFGGIPRLAAGGPPGFIVVGYRPSARGANPIFWHETDGGSWARERSPVVPLTPDPAADECRPAPADAAAFATLDRALAAFCLGDGPLTFRAWAAHCDGCYGGGEGSYEEAWLIGQTDAQLYLSPLEDDTSGWWAPAVVHPSLTYDGSWPGQWLEVTGHLNDPAAPDCRWAPIAAEVWYYEGRRTTVDQCRQQFVVTEVSVVSGP
jgi:hypothetical protein